MADKTLEMTLLFDFFGDLLTDKQREYFDLYHNEDLSLSEIADNVGITRQGVRDIIVRAENTLREYEERTGIVARFEERRRQAEQAEKLALKIRSISGDGEIKSLADELVTILELLKG
jgi:uncharacterized protein